MPRLAMLALLLAAGCAPSPLYVGKAVGTPGEIPRDERGEPIWEAIPPPPAAATPAPAIAVNPGVPIRRAPAS